MVVWGGKTQSRLTMSILVNLKSILIIDENNVFSYGFSKISILIAFPPHTTILVNLKSILMIDENAVFS